MMFRTLLCAGLACTAFARTDDPLKTQLEVRDGIPGQSAANAYRILFVGDSITRHGVSDVTRRNLGWDHIAGMAASAAETDYVHRLAKRIQSVMPGRQVEIYFDSQVAPETNHAFKEGTFAEKHARLQAMREDFRPHLVVVQLGEHEQEDRGRKFLEESCDRLFGFLRALTPTPDLVCAGVWLPGDGTKGQDGYAAGWGAIVENTIRASSQKNGVAFASVRDAALDPACRGWGSSAGVRWHPNDKGMAAYADALFRAFAQTATGRATARPTLPAAAEVDWGGSAGAAFRASTERLRQAPYDSVAFLRADLSQELKRSFINYSGDMSGRYIEVATLTGALQARSPILADLLRTLPAPAPDGHVGVVVDWNGPLDKPDPLTAVKLPIFWGQSRLLVGLIEAYEAAPDPRLLELARGIGDFYNSTADRFLDPARDAEFRASGTYAAGYVTCYFPGIEGLVRLHRATSESKYLDQARRMADFLIDYDRLPLDHTHGNLLTQHALLLLYEATGDRGYLDRVLRRWDEVMKNGFVWVTGGMGERFKVGAGYDEGCALADWLRLNLKLWRLTTQIRYLDAADRVLANEYLWNRFPNGGYGQLDFRGDDTGPSVLQPGHHWLEGTWCCTLHGLLGLNDLKRHLLAGSADGIFVNFPADAAADIRARDRMWRVATELLAGAGDSRRMRITVQARDQDAQDAPTVPVRLRRPSWAAGVDIVGPAGASLAVAEEDGYLRFEVASGVPVTATFVARPRLEDRRFGVLPLDPSKISRHARVVLTCGPELLMAGADRPPVVVLAVGPDGQLVLPPALNGVRRLVTVASLEADASRIEAVVKSDARLKVGPWSAISHDTPMAFVFDAIIVPSNSVLGQMMAAHEGARPVSVPDLPDPLIVEAYEKAAVQNVLAAVNPGVFFGYWSVCADGKGHGYANTYPALDGHQMTDALLWLGQDEVVQANWDYVKQFQRENGQLPFAIWPGKSGHDKLWFTHHVPGDPLRALPAPTYIQNADVIFRFTRDREWLVRQLPSVNLAADHLASLVTPEGAVGGAGYYVERPARIEFDGVAQGHAVDAFRRLAELNAVAGQAAAARKYRELADRIETHFRARFWQQDHFVEYIHPDHGVIANHGLTDVDWSALATDVATPEQRALLWPRLQHEPHFYYGGMPTGIATRPDRYEKWETGDRMDLAAMGRVWYLEAWARARMGDSAGLVASIRRVCEEGRDHGFFWRERYGQDGGFGVEKYCEYPANLIRIVQRFLLGVEFGLDGGVVLRPTVPDRFWDEGFGQTLAWGDRVLSYRMQRGRLTGTYSGKVPLRLGAHLGSVPGESEAQATINGAPAASEQLGDLAYVTLPAVEAERACRFELRAAAR